MADAKDAARGSRLSMESKKRHLDALYRFALKKCDDKAAGTSFKNKNVFDLYVHSSFDNSIRKVCEGTRLDGRIQV